LAEEALGQIGHGVLVDEQHRQLDVAARRLRFEHGFGQAHPAHGVDRLVLLLVGREDLDAHQLIGFSARSYACTMSWTMRWRTTSRPLRWTKAKPSIPLSTSSSPASPLRPPARSTWVTSPVMTAFDPKPMRVRNIFICSGVAFWASSRMMKLELRVRPRMKASGATSTAPL